MSIDFILFERRKPDNNVTEWNEDSIKTFLEEQKFEYAEIFTEDLFYVAKLNSRSELTDSELTETDSELRYRLLEVTPTISFILQDDPSLNEFLEIDAPKKKLVPIKEETF
jgi:hypothetical protein